MSSVTSIVLFVSLQYSGPSENFPQRLTHLITRPSLMDSSSIQTLWSMIPSGGVISLENITTSTVAFELPGPYCVATHRDTRMNARQGYTDASSPANEWKARILAGGDNRRHEHH